MKVLKILKEKHYTNTKAMTLASVECCRCGARSTVVHQNALKHNRLGRTHCQACVDDRYHKMTGTRIWRIWSGMKSRASNVGDKDYGGRDIKLCDEWQDFTRFYQDMSQGYADHLTIERVDVNGGYCKENCTWVTAFAQQGNKRNNRVLVYKGEEMHLAELCRRTELSKTVLVNRLNKGMSADAAVASARASTYGKSQDPVNVKRRAARTSTT